MQLAYKQLILPLAWANPACPEDFVVSDCNRYAYEWLGKWPSKIQESFVCLVGDSGSGKSYLASIWAQKVGATVFNAGSKIFEQWISMSANTESRYFVLDDADMVEDEILLFYIYNTIREHNSYLLLTARQPPIRWNISLPDVRSRLLTINVLNIQHPDEKVMRGIIKQSLRQCGLEAAEPIVKYIENNVERSYGSLNCLINKIDSMINGKSKLTLDLVKKVMNQH